MIQSLIRYRQFTPAYTIYVDDVIMPLPLVRMALQSMIGRQRNELCCDCML